LDAIALYDLGLSEADYNNITLRFFFKLMDRRRRDLEMRDLQFAQIAQILANAFRDQKKRRQPYKTKDFLVLASPKPKEQTPEEIVSIVEALNAAFGGKDTRRKKVK